MKNVITKVSFIKGIRTSEYFLDDKRIGYGVAVYDNKGQKNTVIVYDDNGKKLGETESLVSARKILFKMIGVEEMTGSKEEVKEIKSKTKGRTKKTETTEAATQEQVVSGTETSVQQEEVTTA